MNLTKKLYKERVTKTMLFVALIFFTFNLFGQERFIEESTQSFSELNESESNRFYKIQSRGMYTNYNLVEFGSLAELQEEGKITINLPDDDCEDLIYKAKSVKYESELDYVWYGVLESTAEEDDCDCRLGTITLISSEHGKIGHIIVDDKTFEVLQIGDDKFLLAELDGSKFTESECGVDHKTPVHGLENERNLQLRNNGNCDVRCLVLFTNNALLAEGDVAAINNRVNLAIEQTNQALSNSDVDACQLRIELAGVEPFGFIESQFIDVDVNALANDVNAQILRNAFGADIVVMLTDGPYGGTFGIVEAIGPNDNSAYSIVETGAATTGRFTFAHEVAHLFGGGHDNDPRDGIPHGHSFRTGNFLPCIFGSKQRTILHRAGADDVRIQHYSNPDVKFDGKKTGKKDKRDNARQLRNEACVVAQFRQTIQPFAVNISGDLFMCPCRIASLEANVFGGTAGATYDYDWFISNDGINWNPLPFGGPNAGVTVPCTEGDGVFVRVDVVGSDGNTGSSTTFVEAAMEWPGQVAPCAMLLVGGSSETTLSVSPNPINRNSQSEIILQVKEQGTYTISVKDINGATIINVIDGADLDVGTHRFPINISQYDLLFIHSIDSKGNQITKKLLKF